MKKEKKNKVVLIHRTQVLNVTSGMLSNYWCSEFGYVVIYWYLQMRVMRTIPCNFDSKDKD